MLLKVSRSSVQRSGYGFSKLAARCLSDEAGAPYEYIITEIKDRVGLITLNRPKALNALCNGLMNEVLHACKGYDKLDQVGAIVITGSDKAFAAGADIKEMAPLSYAECYSNNLFANWADIPKVSKPVRIVFSYSGVCRNGVAVLVSSTHIAHYHPMTLYLTAVIILIHILYNNKYIFLVKI